MARQVTALMYHGITLDKSKNSYTLTYYDFVGHLEYLQKNDYKTLVLEDHISLVNNESLGESTDRAVLITFDDGHESDFIHVLPALQKYGFRATFFITTDWIGKPGYMSEAQILALKKAGMSIQSHSQTHRFLNELDYDGIYCEMKASKDRLEKIIGDEVLFLSFPGGRYNADAIKCAADLNFKALYTSVPFQIKRYGSICLLGRYGVRYLAGEVNIDGILSLGSVQRIIARGAYQIKDFLKKLLGNKVYYFIWKKVMKE